MKGVDYMQMMIVVLRLPHHLFVSPSMAPSASGSISSDVFDAGNEVADSTDQGVSE